MRTKIKLLVTLTLASLAWFTLLSKNNTLAASERGALASPYSAHCASCHGRDGRADTAKGHELDADDLTIGKVQNMTSAKMTKIIKNGKGDMPAFKNLSAAQISSIIRTVKSF